MQWLLEHVHIYSGLPWSLSIVATTLLVRVGVFYFYIRQADTAARTAALSPIVKPLNEKMLEHMRAGNQQAAMTFRKQISAVYKDADIHPFKAALGPLMQAMLGFGAFRLIRGMADLPVPGLQNEGLLWIADLTKSDPYLILPVAVAGMMHLVVRVRTHLPQTPLLHLRLSQPSANNHYRWAANPAAINSAPCSRIFSCTPFLASPSSFPSGCQQRCSSPLS